MHRKRLSGAQYKKAAREKEEREKKAINQTIKLDKFLYVKNIDDANQTNVNSRHSSSTVLDQSNDVIPTDGVEINNVISSSESEFPNLTAEEIIKLIPTDSVEIINKITSNFESETPNLTTKEIIHETISTPETCNILESSFSFNKDPAFWTVNEHARDYFSINGFDVNIYKNCDFINSKLESRCMTKNMFERLLPYGEKIERFWLVYSESTGKAVCGPCFYFQVVTMNPIYQCKVLMIGKTHNLVLSNTNVLQIIDNPL